MDKQSLTAGKAIFTLELPEQFQKKHELPTHYTYRIQHRAAHDNYDEAYFVGLLTGPCNTEDYTYMGMLDVKRGIIRLTKASRYNEKSWPYMLLSHVVKLFWSESDTAVAEAKMREAGFWLHNEGYCLRCGRTLTTKLSCLTSLGPWCRKVMGYEFSEEELAEAREEAYEMGVEVADEPSLTDAPPKESRPPKGQPKPNMPPPQKPQPKPVRKPRYIRSA